HFDKSEIPKCKINQQSVMEHPAHPPYIYRVDVSNGCVCVCVCVCVGPCWGEYLTDIMWRVRVCVCVEGTRVCVCVCVCVCVSMLGGGGKALKKLLSFQLDHKR